MKPTLTVLAALLLVTLAALHAAEPIRVLVRDEQQPQQKQGSGEKFLGETIAPRLQTLPDLSVKSAKFDDPEQGLSDATLDASPRSSPTQAAPQAPAKPDPARWHGFNLTEMVRWNGYGHHQKFLEWDFQTISHPEPSIRAAALTALGATVSVQDLPILIARAVAQDKPEEAKAAEAALRAACTRVSDREPLTAKVLEAIASSPVPAKCTLLSVLVTIGGDKALQAVAAAAKDPSGEIRRAGYKALGEWTSADAGPVLLELVKTGDPELKIGALRAYIRVARQFVIPAAQRMAMFKEIMSLAQRDDERRLALDILRQILTTESLAIAAAYLDEPKLCDAAAGVAIAISERIVTIRPQQVSAAMTQVIEQSKNPGILEKARALLNRAEKK